MTQNTPEMQEIIKDLIEITDEKEENRMINGEEEVLPAMTMQEFQVFITEEDSRLKEATENKDPIPTKDG